MSPKFMDTGFQTRFFFFFPFFFSFKGKLALTGRLQTKMCNFSNLGSVIRTEIFITKVCKVMFMSFALALFLSAWCSEECGNDGW